MRYEKGLSCERRLAGENVIGSDGSALSTGFVPEAIHNSVASKLLVSGLFTRRIPS